MMRQGKKKNGWIKMPEEIAKLSQVKYISDNGTYALAGSRYSRGFFVDGRTDGKLWQNLFRVIRNENLDCSLSLRKMSEAAVVQIIYHSKKKQSMIEKEFDKQMEQINALLHVMNVRLLSMNLEERMEWLLYTLDGRNETDRSRIWDYLADFNCQLSMQMSEKDDVIKMYFLRRGQELTEKFIKELRALSGDVRIMLYMEPVSNYSVQKNLRRLYGDDGNVQGEQNNFTNLSFMIFLIASPENMTYMERDLQSVCSHYGQETVLLEETSWKGQSGNLTYLAGTSSSAGRYVRCYQTQVIENLACV